MVTACPEATEKVQGTVQPSSPDCSYAEWPLEGCLPGVFLAPEVKRVSLPPPVGAQHQREMKGGGCAPLRVPALPVLG